MEQAASSSPRNEAEAKPVLLPLKPLTLQSRCRVLYTHRLQARLGLGLGLVDQSLLARRIGPGIGGIGGKYLWKVKAEESEEEAGPSL